MSKKRTSPDSSDDEQTNEGLDSSNDAQTNEDLDSIFQQDDNTKRARLASLTDTTLQDLPMELIEYILVKAVTMEVKDMAKCVWKEKSDLVISRLRTVCSQWSNILTNNFFRNELQRTFDALEMIRIDILEEKTFVLPPNTFWIHQVIATMDQVFIIGKVEDQEYFKCDVYDRNNMAEVKDVIPLPGKYPPNLAASSSESNCVHAVCRETFDQDAITILRIAKDDGHRFTASPLITDMLMPINALIETPNGSLIFSKQQTSEQLTVISIYDASGFLQRETKVSAEVLRVYKVIPRSNGNLVLVSFNQAFKIKLTEIDIDGTILRQYQSSRDTQCCVCAADKYGRILIADRLGIIELLDSEFNRLEFTGPQLDVEKLYRLGKLHYNRERNEMVFIASDRSLMTLRTVF